MDGHRISSVLAEKKNGLQTGCETGRAGQIGSISVHPTSSANPSLPYRGYFMRIVSGRFWGCEGLVRRLLAAGRALKAASLAGGSRFERCPGRFKRFLAWFAGRELNHYRILGAWVVLLTQACGAANRPAMVTHSSRHGAVSGK